jgi:TonB-dependent SusC/RagA subfamily outer membrane receptor
MLKKILIITLSVCFLNSLSAQKSARKIEIKGRVLDVYNAPIANAILMVDNKKTSSITDSRGNYKVKVRSDALKIGVFTFGNGIMEDEINGRSRINFKFNSYSSVLPNYYTDGEKGVSNGYGMVKKKNLTTEVSQIDGMNSKYSTYSSIKEMIMREVSGVQLRGSDIIIQGSRNFYGYVTPLIVVDGVNMSRLPDIPPSTVRSIEVLKGTAASIYGTMGNGGVIIIKTKIQN